MFFRKIFLIFILQTFFPISLFSLELKKISGSDLGMGVGARAISLSGAFSAVSDDSSSCFWNPAGLSQIKKNEFSIMIDLPNQISFISLLFAFPKSDFSFAISRVNRLIYKGEGNWEDNPYAGHLIDLSMVNVETNYIGGIDSETWDTRISLGKKITKDFSLGLTWKCFTCITNFYNEGAGRPQQVGAYQTMDLGTLYKHKNYQFALVLKNAIEKTKPKYFTVGFAQFLKNKTIFCFDSEYIYGHYGANENREVFFWLLRTGLEKELKKKIKLRFGLIFPIKAYTSTLGDLKKNIPSPGVGGSFGVGYTSKNTTFDLALFGDPGRSYIEHKPVVSVSLSLTKKF